MKRLLFGTAGIPHNATGKATAEAIQEVRKLGLDAMELEFVRSINISEEKAPAVKESAKNNDIVLTCHAPYFINLNAHEKPKLYASINRILQSAKIADLCGAYSVAFHPGFYMKEDHKKVYNKIKEQVKLIVKELQENSNKIWLRPETTGKSSAFGDYKELINLSEEVEQVLPCIDFAHLHARSIGKINSYEEFSDVLSLVEKKLGKKSLENMHIHTAGINYTDKGERNHLNLEESDMNYKDLMKALKDFRCKGVLICESPNIEEDAILMKKTFESI